MEKWIYYSLILVIIYIIWTIMFEYVIKKHTDCLCISLFTYIIAGIISILILKNHIHTGECKHYESISDIKNISKTLLLFLIIMAICIILVNKYWAHALSHGGNSGHITSISNLSIIFVTVISTYLFDTKIKKEHIIGIGLMLGGSYFLTKC